MKHIKNPIAKDLRTPKYRLRVVKDKKSYDRKAQKREDQKSSLSDVYYPAIV